MPHTTKYAQIGPLAVQLEVEFLDRISEPVRDKKAASVSAIIRTALERYDFTNMVVLRAPQVMISVRLPVDIRRNLKRLARTKHTSVGQLIRSAVEAYLPHLETEIAGQLEMPIVEPAPVESVLQPAKPRRKMQRKARPPRHPAKSKTRRIMTKKRKG